MTTRVAVIGGGITGLAAAWELSADPDVEITVLEAGPRWGGKIHTSKFAGMPVDEGADAFLRRVPEGLTLAGELALEDRLVSPAASNALVWARGQLRELPAGLVLGVPTDLDAVAASGILTAAGVDRARAEADLGGPPLGADETIGSLVRRRYGDDVLEHLVEPLIGGINAGEADRLSVDAVTPQIAEAARRGPSLTRTLRDRPAVEAGPVFSGLSTGMGTLIDELTIHLAARGATLLTGTTAGAVESVGAGWRVVGEDLDLLVDAVIVTVPCRPAARLIAPIAPAAAGLLQSITASSVAMVTIGFDPHDLGRPLDASGFLVPRDAGLTITAASWASTKWAHLGGGPAILRVSVGHDTDPEPVSWDDDRILAAVLADLDATVGVRGEPTEVRICRYVDGLPQYAVGHLDLCDRIDSELASTPGLLVTGAAFRGLGIPACIRQGRAAGRAVLDLDPAR